MNDSRDLKAIAEACQQHQPLRFMRSHGALYIRNDNGIVFDVHQNRSFPEFMAQNKDYADLALAANPETILALIDENDRVKARLCACRDCGGQGEIYSGHDTYQGHFQPPEPDMDVCGTCGGDGVLGPLEDFEVLAAERDQLKADNEALRKDSESYRLLSFCHGQGTLELVRSHHELCAEIRRLKILAGEPVPPTPEEFVGPSPEGPTARIRRKLAAMGKGEQS
ncbi:hypothetical protein [Pseudomonas sp. EA_15y_Pfl1_P102]|uniref:hypothetical protein n=1 Tax=Pseudomonas sp. EA_15y_Pfl1_P102 TaxID=3088685 RepID=UPI0030DDB30B